jgi:hypothetical protein
MFRGALRRQDDQGPQRLVQGVPGAVAAKVQPTQARHTRRWLDLDLSLLERLAAIHPWRPVGRNSDVTCCKVECCRLMICGALNAIPPPSKGAFTPSDGIQQSQADPPQRHCINNGHDAN